MEKTSLDRSSLTPTTDKEGDSSIASSPVPEGHIRFSDGEHSISYSPTSDERKSIDTDYSSPRSWNSTSQKSISEDNNNFTPSEITSNKTETIPQPDLFNQLSSKEQEALQKGEIVVTITKPASPKKSAFSTLFSSRSSSVGEASFSQSSIYTAYKLVNQKKVPLQKLQDTAWIPELNQATLPGCTEAKEEIRNNHFCKADYFFNVEVPRPLSTTIEDKVSMKSEKKTIEGGGFEISFEQENKANYVEHLKGKVTAIPHGKQQILTAYQLAGDFKGVAKTAVAAAKTLGTNVKEQAVKVLLENVIEESSLPDLPSEK